MKLITGDCLMEMAGMTTNSVDLVLFSPPYPLKTMRYDGARKKMKWQEWAAWISQAILEACRVSRGFVLVNMNNPVKDGRCLPAIEMAVMLCHTWGLKMERPIIWHKNSPPNARPWWVNCWEPIYAFYEGERPQVWNWEAIATPPKYSNGGAFRQRDANGVRKAGSAYPKNKLTRPRDVWYVTVGGGHMGSNDAHGNEAPFPEGIVRPFILALTNPGDTVLDPFCGSGTTCKVALELGRKAIGIDIRSSEISRTRKRCRASQDSPSV